MPKLVAMGAMMQCTMGATPGSLIVIPTGPPTMTPGPLAATIMDHKPIANIPTFGMCKAPTNPAVIAIIASSLGSVTQAPCVPATTSPWMPGATKVKINNMPALHQSCKLLCTWLGTISINSPSQTATDVT